MPLIAISIANQRMTVYDNGVPVAHAPVSTGTASHPTPMGIFSVIQKERYHVSNIYSGAPMPFMQRITWSGVAMHAGVLPGYPASHGCIRLPHDFATKLYSLTRAGARVIITRNEIAPVEFEHQRLFVLHKTEPSKVGVVNEPKAERSPSPETDGFAQQEGRPGNGTGRVVGCQGWRRNHGEVCWNYRTIRRIRYGDLPSAHNCRSVAEILRGIICDRRRCWAAVCDVAIRVDPVNKAVGFSNKYSLRADRFT